MRGKKNTSSEENSTVLLPEIVSSEEGFLIRYGIYIFISIIVAILISCWFIRFPDVVKGSATLISTAPPQPVVSHVNGKLIKLHASENADVRKGDILGYLEAPSNADHEEVLRLISIMDSVQRYINENKQEQLPLLFQYSFHNLGDLQHSYQTLYTYYLSYKGYFSNGYDLKKVRLLENDITILEKEHENLLDQKGLYNQDLSIAERKTAANKTLREEKVISEFDFESEQSWLLTKRLSVKQIEAGLISNERSRNEKQREVYEIRSLVEQQSMIFQQALNTFRSEMDDWKRKYFFIAPVSGKVSFPSLISESKYFQNDETFCFINPPDNKYYAQIMIPQANLGKVFRDQRVMLKLPSYPYQEYGILEGRIGYISNISSEKGYWARVELTNGLKTSYNKEIGYRTGLIADGEIIVKEMRLLERFYYNMYQ